MFEVFQRDGVIALRDFATPEQCRDIQGRALELVEAFDPESVRSVFSVKNQSQLNDDYFNNSGDKIRFFFEAEAFDDEGSLQQPVEQSLNKMGHAMHDLDPVFEAFSRQRKIAALVDSLGFDDPGLLQSMYIFKPPRIGGEVGFHQDSTFLYTEPESCIGLWFALEDATVQNGCMQFLRGAHKEALKQINRRQADGTFAIETLDSSPWDEGRRALAEAPAGTVVIFDGRVPHMSDHNFSERSRHAYTLHVIEKSSNYPKENWLQRGPDLPLRGFEAS